MINKSKRKNDIKKKSYDSSSPKKSSATRFISILMSSCLSLTFIFVLFQTHKYLPTNILLIISVLICFVFSFVTGILIHNFRKKLKAKLSNTICLTITSSCMIASAFITLGMIVFQILAFTHGMYDITMPYERAIVSFHNSPTESKLPENKDDLVNSLIIYYKFGCPDCEAVFSELQAKLPQNNNVYWVSTRSKQGKELRKIYPVSQVPSIAYITSRKTAVIEEIAIKSKDGIKLNNEKLNKILNLYSR